ncbi:MAG: DUF4836 family protein [Paraprevotella sp.]|nr:DUF4836 family protein [Paraprevotella sp.]MBP3472101.1 DUF4836 family protein [Paraprevotella sp.]
MKRTGLVVAVLAAIVAVGVGLYWAFSSEPVYKRALPADAVAYMCVDGKALDKALDLKEIAKTVGLEIDEDMQDCGVDWSEKVYIFMCNMCNEKSAGVLACMNDADKLTAYLNLIDPHYRDKLVIEERDGYYWVMVDGSILVGYNDEKLLAVGQVNAYNKAQVRQQMLLWLGQDESESGLNTPLYKKLDEKEGIFTYAASGNAIPEEIFTAIKKQMMGQLPGQIADLRKINVAGAVQVDRKKLSCPLEVFTEDEALNASWDVVDKQARKLGSDFIEQAPEGMVMWLGANVVGETMLEQLRSNPDLRTMLVGLNMMADVDNILKSIDGNMMVAVGGESAEVPTVLLTADVKDKNVLKELPNWLKPLQMKCTTVSENEFLVNTPAGDIAAGVRKDILYLTNQSLLAENVGKSNEAVELKPYKSEIKDSYLFILFSMPNFMKSTLYKTLSRNDMSVAMGCGMASRIIKDVVLRASDARHTTFEIYWVEDSEMLKSYLK